MSEQMWDVDLLQVWLGPIKLVVSLRKQEIREECMCIFHHSPPRLMPPFIELGGELCKWKIKRMRKQLGSLKFNCYLGTSGLHTSAQLSGHDWK